MKTIQVHRDRTEIRLTERIGAEFGRTLCGFELTPHQRLGGKHPSRVTVDGVSVPFQWEPADARLYVHLSLEPLGTTAIEVFFADAPPAQEASDRVQGVSDATIVKTSSGAVKLPPLGMVRFPQPMDSFNVPAPIGTIQLAGGPWRGKGYLDTRARVLGYECRQVQSGPLFDRLELVYHFEGGGDFLFECQAVAGEPWLRVGQRAALGPKARWWLDFHGDWLPDHVTLLDNSIAYKDRRLTYFHDVREARLYHWTQASQLLDLREGLGFYQTESPEYFAWFAADGNRWRGAKVNFIEFWQRRMLADQPLTKGEETFAANWDWMPPGNIPAQGRSVYQGHLTAETLLADTCLRYGLLIGDKNDYVYSGPVPAHDLEWYCGPVRLEEWKRIRSPLRALSIQQGMLSLDVVKDWQLAPADAPASGPGPLAPGPAPHAAGVDRTHRLFENKLTEQERAADLSPHADEILLRMEQYLAMQAAGYFACRGPASTNPVTLRAAAPYAFLFRDMVRLGLVSPQRRRGIHARLAFLAHLTSQEFFYPAHSSMASHDDGQSTEPTFLGMCNQNFLTDVYATHGAVALTLDHPQKDRWLARFDELLDRQLDFHVYPESGVWEESHTYFHHVLYTVLPVLFEQKAAGLADWFADGRFQRMASSLLHTFTPPDPNFGARIVAPLGDHGAYVHSPTPNILAEGFAHAAPRLAANLAWMAAENGYTGALAVEPVEPQLTGGIVQGLCGVFRHDCPAGRSMVILRAGASWGHHNNDELSLHYYSAGEPVIVEAGYGAPKTFSKAGPSGHSCMTPAAFDPLCYLGKFNRGWIEHFQDARLPWSLRAQRLVAMLEGVRRDGNPAIPMDIFPYRQTRELFFLPPDILIVRDRHDGVYEHQLYWHTGGKDMKADANRLLITGHGRNSVLATFADVQYEVQADAKTFGARAKTGLAPEVITAIVSYPIGDPAPTVSLEDGQVVVNSRKVWPGAC